ncbi:MAG: peptidoglycan D,D-transpeptidase FtsI family protein [Actinomycetota bacterium]
MDRQIRRLAVAMAVMFAILFAQVNYLQVFAADDLAGNPANFRIIIQEYKIDRGAILARDLHTELARSVPTKGRLKFLRLYPQGPLYADVTGYYSLVYGRSRIESSENTYLGAHASELLPSTIEDEILNRPKRGADVVTTIDPQLQQAASAALSGRPGAAVAMDPRTGEVLAMVSNPSYDPTELSSHDPGAIRRAWKQLNDDPSKPLLSNATDQIYPPGSTFKLIDTAAALENGYTPQSRLPNPSELTLPQTTHKFHNFAGVTCPGGSSITLAAALTVSCDITFAELGLKLGAEVLSAEAEKFGFNQNIPFDVPLAEGRFPPASFFPDRLPLLAFSAIGQADVAANPLQMALVASAIANHGVEMRPQLVKEIRGPGGDVLRSFHPQPWGQPIRSDTAATMTQMMVDVVRSGTGTPAQIPGVDVAAKTGTAQTPSGNPHVWFVAFAPAQNPEIAVAVVLLNGGGNGAEATGGTVAGPVAKAIIQAALGIGE